MLAIICFLSGIVLSFRFRVSILIPLTLMSGGVAFVLGMAGGKFASALLNAAFAAVSLQVGYLLGSVFVAGVISMRRSKHRVRSRKPVPARSGV